MKNFTKLAVMILIIAVAGLGFYEIKTDTASENKNPTLKNVLAAGDIETQSISFVDSPICGGDSTIAEGMIYDYRYDMFDALYESIPYSNHAPYVNFIDVNGDGLNDFLFSEKSGGTYGPITFCYSILLNKGNKFEPGYTCSYAGKRVGDVLRYGYKGDCADPETIIEF